MRYENFVEILKKMGRYGYFGIHSKRLLEENLVA